jgi:hypothetical protein
MGPRPKPKPWLDLTPKQILAIRNAQKHVNAVVGKTIFYDSDESISSRKYGKERNRHANNAYKQLQDWVKPGTSVPLGVARYFLHSIESMQCAMELGVFDKLKDIAGNHLETCPNNCEALVHPGQQVPDLGSIAMISATSTSFSNFSGVVAAAPQHEQPRTVGEGPSKSTQQSSPSFPFSDSEDFSSIYR